MTDTSTAAVTALMHGVTPSRPGNRLHVNHGQVWKTGEAWRVLYDVPDSLAQRHVAIFDSEKDARFFAAARDLVPALLAERDALKARAEAAEAALREIASDDFADIEGVGATARSFLAKHKGDSHDQ